jgi:hypothetical protein
MNLREQGGAVDQIAGVNRSLGEVNVRRLY